MGKQTWTEVRTDRLKKAYLAGATPAMLAERFGTSRSRVVEELKRIGVYGNADRAVD